MKNPEDCKMFALEFVLQNGYKLISRNYYTRDGELDIIVEKSGILVFVEVKFRRNQDIRTILESVNHTKQKRLIYLK